MTTYALFLIILLKRIASSCLLLVGVCVEVALKQSEKLTVVPDEQALKRNRKNNRTRRHFAEEAVVLFEEKGFSATTVEEIAVAADYSTSTFFRMFSDKEDVVFYDFNDRLEELNSTFALPEHDNAWVVIRNNFIRFGQIWDNDEGQLGIRRLRVIYDEPVLHARFLAKASDWEGYMADLIMNDADGPKDKLLCQVLAGAASAAFRAGLKVKLENDSLTLAECVENAFDQLEKISDFFPSSA